MTKESWLDSSQGHEICWVFHSAQTGCGAHPTFSSRSEVTSVRGAMPPLSPFAFCRAQWQLYLLIYSQLYRGADKSLALPGRKQDNVPVRMARISFGALSCRGEKLMTARVSMLLKSRASLTCFRACFLPGRAKDLSAPLYFDGTVTLVTGPVIKESYWNLTLQFSCDI